MDVLTAESCFPLYFTDIVLISNWWRVTLTILNVNVFSPCPDYVKGSAEIAIQIHQREHVGDILIFLTGWISSSHMHCTLSNRRCLYFLKK